MTTTSPAATIGRSGRLDPRPCAARIEYTDLGSKEAMRCSRAIRTGTRDVGVLPYVSPRERELTPAEAHVRALAYALKRPRPPRAAIEEAVSVMAPYVGPSDVLVPLPNSKGETTSNLMLARALAVATGAGVADVLGREREVPSSHERRRQGQRGLHPMDHRMVLRGAVPRGSLVLIDNVVTTGSTFEAARRTLGRGRGLAYARARELTT